MTPTAAPGYLTAAVTPAAAMITGHLWLAVAAAAVPCVLACVTAIVLVLSVDRGNRVEAIKALPPVITAISKTALTTWLSAVPGTRAARPERPIPERTAVIPERARRSDPAAR